MGLFFMGLSALAKAAAPSLIGKMLGSGTPKPNEINEDELKARQLKTQGLVDENLGLSRQLRDPQSAVNLQMRNMHQATGGVNQNWMNALQKRFTQGTGIMGKMTGIQQGLDENMGNAYLSNLNMRNQFAQDQHQNQMGGLLGGFNLGQKMDLGLGGEGQGKFANFLGNLFQGGG